MYERIRRLLDALATDLYEREEPVRLGVLAAVAGESLFLLGPPGVGKSLIARRLQQAFRDARSFSYLMGRFSTPDEVFGPLSIRTLREHDRYERNTEHYLPDSEVVFLDEIWKASPPIQNALLTALNERLYRNGTREVRLPLKIFVGASNELPAELEETAAFWDRFLVRLVLRPVAAREEFERLLADTSDVYRPVVPETDRLSDAELAELERGITGVTLPPPVLSIIADIRSALARGNQGSEGEAPAPVYVSDRRWKKIARLLRTSALLHGRREVEPIDCGLIAPCAWTTPEERDFVSRVVDSAVARHAGEPDRAEAASATLERLRADVDGRRAVTVERTEEAPVLHRNEYYRLDPVDARPGSTPGHAGADVITLVWHGDFDELVGGVPAEVDLFHYDTGGELVESERIEAVRRSGWETEAAGRRYRVRTAPTTVTVTETRELSDADRTGTRAKLDSLLREIDAGLDSLTARRSGLLAETKAHLFLGSRAAELVAGALETTALRLSELRLHALGLADEL